MNTAQPLWTSTDAAAATGGRATERFAATGLSIDTRTLEKGDMFVALGGPNFDGHDFVADAFGRGASSALVSREIAGAGPQLVVAETLDGLTALARAGRARMTGRVAAITGSVGKTGTKEALAHALAAQGSVSASKSSLNNHWGVPLSIARMPADADYGVFEIGMNHPGEITPLVALAKPDVAVVTAIAAAHMAFFNSLEEIAHAKAEIFTGLDGGTAVINRDAPHFDLLAHLALQTGASHVVTFGRHAAADMRLLECVSDAEGSDVEARWQGREIRFRIGQPGTHWAYNALAVLAAADAMGADLDGAAESLATLPALPGRGAVHAVAWGEGRIRLIDDAYNANPESMAAALKTLGHMIPDGGRRVAVLGDMRELGRTSRDAHAALADHVEKNGIDVVFLCGPEMKALADSLPAGRVAGHAADAASLLPIVIAGLRAGDVVTVKASNGTGLGRIVNALLDRASAKRAANGN